MQATALEFDFVKVATIMVYVYVNSITVNCKIVGYVR